MPLEQPDDHAELLNFVLAGQLECRAPQQRQFGWICADFLARLCTSAPSVIGQEERVKHG